MELVFHKENGLYITEFEVTSDFNVHLERSKGGKVSFYQKTTDGNYDHIEKLSKNIDKVFDYDFQALVYPKIIKITSECEFDVASLTTDGEVTEIKSQSKEVEITSNGVTEIAPDAGFGYLSGVKVNVNVPTGGGGGDAPSGGSSYEYYDISNIENNKYVLVATAALVKTSDSITTLGIELNYHKTIMDVVDSINAIAIDKDCKMFPGQEMTVGEYFAMTQSYTGTNPTPITKEEFYNLGA